MQTIPISPLGQFFGAYLHQDYLYEYPDAWSAVEDYVASEPLEERRLARSELVTLLQRCQTEKGFSVAADHLNLYYYPPAHGETYREWLEKVERYLADHED